MMKQKCKIKRDEFYGESKNMRVRIESWLSRVKNKKTTEETGRNCQRDRN